VRDRGRSLTAMRSVAAERIAGAVTRHSRLVVAIWVALVAVLAIQGRDAQDELAIHPVLVDGSSSARAHEISLREFGNAYPMVVLLRGPQAAIERQGGRLAARLDKLPKTLVASPWVEGATVEGLNPRPGVGALLVRTASPEGDTISGLLPPVERRVDATVKAPVRADIAGLPVIIDSARNANNNASALGELIAVPVLLLVLLFAFRSILAAITPLLIGGTVVISTQGILSLLSGVVEIDLFGLVVSAMMGLALGVDYSLLVVSRFREERERLDHAGAIQATLDATTRSILPAGGALLLAMLIVPVLLPGVLIQSVAIGVGIATVLSMLAAFCIVPALLTVYGRHLDRWSLPRCRRASGGTALAWSRGLRKRPGVALAFILGLLVLSALAFNLRSGAGSVAMLPTADPGRLQQENVERALGPGWVAPIEVVVDGRGRPVTSPPRLRALAAFQRRVEADPGVASATGLAAVARGSGKLAGLGATLVRQERSMDRLQSGIAKAAGGAAKTSMGFRSAAAGSRKLGSGAEAANAGAGSLTDGLRQTSAGSVRLARGLGRASEGSGQVARGTQKASSGAGRLAEGLAQAEEKTGEIQGSARLFKNAMRSGEARLAEVRAPLDETEEQLAAARQSLQRMTSGRSDPEYAAALAAVEAASGRLTGTDPSTGEPVDPAYDGVEAGVEGANGQFEVGTYLAERLDRNGRQAATGIAKLARGAERLDRGLLRLSTGGRELSDAVAALSEGGGQLSPALQRLSQGAAHLAGGLGLLAAGGERLASGLEDGANRSRALPLGLHRIVNRLREQGANEGESASDLVRGSPGLFRSAYFVLATLDGSRPGRRAKVGTLVNIDSGGTDARLLVVPRYEPNTDEAKQLLERLETDGDGLARETGAEVLVGGVAAGDIAINEEFRGQTPLIRLALSLVSLIILVPLLRSLIVPLLTVLINLVTVSATFGLLSLLFNGSLLGGPGYVDALIVPEIIIVIFALAIDYEVFIFARIREEYLRTGSTSEAVARGLDRTAHVVSGAALIMITVFLAFAVSELITVRNFGTAQAIAVFIDAFIVRLVVVPAVMLWLGDRCWWMPPRLSRFGMPSRRSPAPPG
jgi:RND superfamily putative drug exporter